MSCIYAVRALTVRRREARCPQVDIAQRPELAEWSRPVFGTAHDEAASQDQVLNVSKVAPKHLAIAARAWSIDRFTVYQSRMAEKFR